MEQKLDATPAGEPTPQYEPPTVHDLGRLRDLTQKKAGVMDQGGSGMSD
jgi:hypothetical protein